MKKKKYSVLLLYPDYASENYGEDTFYTGVDALNEKDAVAIAQTEASEHLGGDVLDPSDFACLLIISGHHVALEIPRE